MPGRARDVAVDEFERVGAAEWKGAGEQFVQRYPQRIQVRATIEQTVCATGLLGREVGQGAFEFLDADRALGLPRQVGRDSEVDQFGMPGRAVEEEVMRFDVLVDEVVLVGYTLAPRSLAAGETFTLTLYWQPSRPQYDYAVFAQVIDSAWDVWGSQDGAGPGWSSDQVVQDVRRITVLPDTPPGSYSVQVGLFHSETGRLPVVAPEGHHVDDRVLLGPVRVHD